MCLHYCFGPGRIHQTNTPYYLVAVMQHFHTLPISNEIKDKRQKRRRKVDLSWKELWWRLRLLLQTQRGHWGVNQIIFIRDHIQSAPSQHHPTTSSFFWVPAEGQNLSQGLVSVLFKFLKICGAVPGDGKPPYESKQDLGFVPCLPSKPMLLSRIWYGFDYLMHGDINELFYIWLHRRRGTCALIVWLLIV